jgi:hypothetical protein
MESITVLADQMLFATKLISIAGFAIGLALVSVNYKQIKSKK